MRTAILAFSLLFVSAAAASEAPVFSWPEARPVSRVEVPGRLEAMGVPVRMRLLRLRESASELWKLYSGAFRRANLFVAPPERQVSLAGAPMITAYDPRRQVSYSVALWENGDGTTTALLAEANLALRTGDGPPGFAPVFPGASEVFVTHQEGAKVMTYEVEGSEPELDRFYARTLTAGGFRRAEDGGWVRGAELLHVRIGTRGGRRWVAIVQRAGEGR